MKWLVFVVCLAAVSVTDVSVAAAQSGEVDVTRYDVPLDQSGFNSWEGSATPGPGRGNVGFHGGYVLEPSRLITDHRVTGAAFAQVGIGGRVAVGLRVPTLLYVDTNELRQRAVGDPTLVTRIRIFGRPTTHRWLPEGSGMALRFAVRAPAGQRGAQISEDQVVLDTHLIADWRVLGFDFGATLGWRFRPERRVVEDVVVDDELHLGIGLELPNPFWAAMSFPLEVRGSVHAASPFTRRSQTAFEGMLGVRIRLPRVALNWTLGRRHSPGIGNPRVRLMFTLSWKPRVWDLDRDGVRDRRDACPHEPEDRWDRDGCPGS